MRLINGDHMLTSKIAKQPRRQPEIVPIYAILGMLNAYSGGRMVSDNEHIESFSRHEKAWAARCAEWLEQLAREEGVDAAITQRVTAEGAIWLSSPTLAPIINSRYEMKSLVLPIRYDDPELAVIVEMLWGPLREPIFPPQGPYPHTPEGRNSRLSYLLGVYARSGIRTTIFCHSDHEAVLVTTLLKEVGCPYVSWAFEAGYIPTHNYIMFRPSWDLATILGLPVPAEDD
jgi:hypothetical protein